MIGYLLIFMALIVTMLSAISFFSNLQPKREKADKLSGGKVNYYAAFGFIAGALGYLLSLIVSDQFQYAYVFGYSSTDLPLVYKFSALWAGQDGSFLLWVFLHSLLGVTLLGKKQATDGMIAVHAVLQLMLLVILIVKSPFALLPANLPDGAGLNPLLQDPWMVIHPPIVFLGYAGLGIPFSYAIGSLISREQRNWLQPALVWSLLSWGVLGAGIFIGGFWAYKVLGWGGYWAWDPVENSSLIPWLVCGAQVHLLFAALKRPPLIKVACLATLFSFIMVLYGTFLTRSGILSNFSTHSFTNEGVGGVLAAVVMLALTLSLVVLTVKWPALPSGRFCENIVSSEGMLILAAILLAILAAVTTIGTSTPFVTMLLGYPYSLQVSFYNSMALPIAGALSFTIIMASIMTSPGSRQRHLTTVLTALVGITGTVFSLHYGVAHFLTAVVIGLSCAAVIASLRAFNLNHYARVTHAGVALLIIGIIASSVGGSTSVTTFNKGERVTIVGQSITYHGSLVSDDSKNMIQSFAVGQPSNEVFAITKLSKANQPAVREPAIYHELAGDIYIAPAVGRVTKQKELLLVKQEEIRDNGLALKLIRYGMSNTNPSQRGVYALLEMGEDGKTENVKLELNYTSGEFHAVPIQALDKYQVSLTGLNLAEEKVTIAITNPLHPEDGALEAEISNKPLIGLVWVGAFIIASGTTIAGFRFLRMRKPEADPASRLTSVSKLQ